MSPITPHLSHPIYYIYHYLGHETANTIAPLLDHLENGIHTILTGKPSNHSCHQKTAAALNAKHKAR